MKHGAKLDSSKSFLPSLEISKRVSKIRFNLINEGRKIYERLCGYRVTETITTV
jgi:hypothetical protein